MYTNKRRASKSGAKNFVLRFTRMHQVHPGHRRLISETTEPILKNLSLIIIAESLSATGYQEGASVE